MENILDTLDPAFANVIEFRHESWWNQKVYHTLKENQITFCGISYPALPDQVVRSVPVTYYRFHGVPHLYSSGYSHKKLKQISDDVSVFRGIRGVYIYFNNDIQAEAIRNAQELKKLVAPLRLVASYH